ncbi:MAG: hypothetical protein GOMPHAMPRED_006263 [Gomphillus americanus]|uniref:Uncharacterized protein n=1 Tax=Gomphillus americanus TaxID=1940652 RepID=A0A8H3I614_9LECA|nr:MAG: hypothetical protein GOMPHAMPRED_006263 [Gomphillus americanus]
MCVTIVYYCEAGQHTLNSYVRTCVKEAWWEFCEPEIRTKDTVKVPECSNCQQKKPLGRIEAEPAKDKNKDKDKRKDGGEKAKEKETDKGQDKNREKVKEATKE